MTNLMFTILIRFLIVALFVDAFYMVLVVENRSGMFSDPSIGGMIMGLVGVPIMIIVLVALLFFMNEQADSDLYENESISHEYQCINNRGESYE